METKQNSCSFSLDLGVVNKGFVKFIIAARAPRFENYLVWKKSISGFKFHLKNHHAFLITAICMSVPPFRPSVSLWIFNDLCCTGSYSTAIHVTDTSIRASSLVLTHFSFRSERQKKTTSWYFSTLFNIGKNRLKCKILKPSSKYQISKYGFIRSRASLNHDWREWWHRKNVFVKTKTSLSTSTRPQSSCCSTQKRYLAWRPREWKIKKKILLAKSKWFCCSKFFWPFL